MDDRLNQFINAVKDTFRLFFSISLGIFLFILFFQPFPIDHPDFSNKLIFIAGFAGIVYLILVLVRIASARLFQDYTQSKERAVLPYYIKGFFLLALNSVAFAFYLHYVGHVSLSFYIMFKIAMICLIPSVTLWINDVFNEFKQSNKLLMDEVREMKQQLRKYEEDYQNISVEFISDKSSENIKLSIADVAFIRSANNYIEIVFKDGDEFRKRLQRNTLKNIEQQLRPYANFMRCHRTCIVNTFYIHEFTRKFNNHWLTVRGYEEQIPVSRQYLVKLKEAINTNQL